MSGAESFVTKDDNSLVNYGFIAGRTGRPSWCSLNPSETASASSSDAVLCKPIF